MYALCARLDYILKFGGNLLKYLLDASVIASSLEDFKRRYISNPDCILILSDLTLMELEARKKDRWCVVESKKFVSYLIDFFVRDTSSTEICRIESECPTKHIDQDIVKWAKEHNVSILTCDKGMALWCRFYNVNCELLEVHSVATLPFVHENNGSLCLNLRQVPIGCSTFIYSPEKNKIMSSLGSDIMFMTTGNVLLVAQPDQKLCRIDTYIVNADLSISLVGRNLYSSEEDIDTDAHPFHFNLYDKWKKHASKFNLI